MSLNPFRRNTIQWAIANELLKGDTRETIFRNLYPLVMSQTSPFVFSNNVGGERIPISPIDKQVPLLFYNIDRVRSSLLDKEPNAASVLAPEDRFQARNYASKQWRMSLYNTVKGEYHATKAEQIEKAENEVIEAAAEILPPVVETEKTNPNSLRGKIEYLYTRLNEIRAFVQSKRVGGRDFDYVSTRAFVYGKSAIIQGIDPDDFLWSIGASWDEDSRRAAGLYYTPNYQRYAIEDTPMILGFLVKLAKAGIPIYLAGPTGSGKSVLARILAEYLEMPYAEIPLSLGVSRTDLFGNWNASGFVNRPFTDRYENGGIFCFEEIDAADPNILLAVNNAIANMSLFNTSNGTEISRHCDFVPVATANTYGSGATANYGGREGLDGSTLDRFKYGRVYVDYNVDIEHEIMFSNIEELESAYAE